MYKKVALFRCIPLVSFLACLSLIVSSCSHGSGWTDPIDLEALGLRKLPGTDEYPDASALILLDEGSMEVLGSGEVGMSVFERHRVIRVLNSAGQQYANVVIPYASGSHVEGIEARTIGPDGTITPVRAEDIFDVSLYPNFVFFSDQRAQLFTLPAVENGSLLEYRYRVRVRGHTLWHSWSFQDKVPVLLSRFTLTSPAQYPVTPKLYGISIEPKGEKMPAGFKQTTVWETRNVPPLQAEFGMPTQKEVEARLAIAPLGFRTWDDVAKWYGELARPRSGAGPRIKEVVKRITAGAPDERTKLRRIFEWVQQQVRYMAVEVGIGGYQPHAAEDVCSKLYGDCKDMSTLISSMAREAGIEVRQALVSTWQNGRPDTSFPSPLQFNHAIAYCPSVDGGLWMDATEKYSVFGELPWYDQGLPVLVIGDDGKGTMVTTPRSSAARNASIDAWDVRLDSAGAALIVGESRFTGMPAIEQRNELADQNTAERRRWLEGYLARRCPGAVLDTMDIDGLQPVGDTLRLRYSLRSAIFGVRNDSRLVLHPGRLSASGLAAYFRSPHRVQPVRFRFGVWNESRLTIHLPPGWRMLSPTLSDSLRSDFGSAHWVYRSRDTVLSLQSGFSIAGHEVDPPRYRAFQEFLDAVQAREIREIEVAGGPGMEDTVKERRTEGM